MHHKGGVVFWILFAILATVVLGPGIWFVLGRNKAAARVEETPPPDVEQPPPSPEP